MAAGAFRSLEPAHGMRGKASKNFGGRKHHQSRVSEAKATGKRAFNQFNAGQRIAACADDFAKTFDLPFGLKIDNDFRVRVSPFIQPIEELLSLCFSQGEVAHRKLTDTAIFKRAAKILRPLFN